MKKTRATEQPKIFTEESILKLLAGTKTQTRRIAKNGLGNFPANVGDLNWVKELWRVNFWRGDFTSLTVEYKVDGDVAVVDPRKVWKHPSTFHKTLNTEAEKNQLRWRTPVYMPKGLARIWLKILNVELKHLDDIGEEDAIAEGEVASDGMSAREQYKKTWRRLHGGANRWEDNPNVFVIEYVVFRDPRESTNYGTGSDEWDSITLSQ